METLLCSKILDEVKNELVCMHYYKLCNEKATEDRGKVKFYGVKVLKFINDILVENESEPNVTDNEEFIDEVINKIITGFVTPSTMIHVIDDCFSID